VTALDYFVIAVVVLSVAISLFRGAVREVLSVASWVVAIFLAFEFSGVVATYLPASVSSPTVRSAAAFIATLLVSLLLLALVSMVITRVIKQSPLSGVDRVLGALIGLVRAVVILTALTLIAGFTTLPKEPFWRAAKSRGPLETLAVIARDYLPKTVAARIHYD
jgi:membrane protein required for colicin V production